MASPEVKGKTGGPVGPEDRHRVRHAVEAGFDIECEASRAGSRRWRAPAPVCCAQVARAFTISSLSRAASPSANSIAIPG